MFKEDIRDSNNQVVMNKYTDVRLVGKPFKPFSQSDKRMAYQILTQLVAGEILRGSTHLTHRDGWVTDVRGPKVRVGDFEFQCVPATGDAEFVYTDGYVSIRQY